MLMNVNKRNLSALVLVVISSIGNASTIDQYASSVIDFSSQWGSPNWSAGQTLGEPNTFIYGDIATSWAPSNINSTLEFLILGL